MAIHTETLSPQDVICRARSLIDKEGWIQGAEHSVLGYCLKGACDKVIRDGAPQVDRPILESLVVGYLAYFVLRPG
ncbi:MAG: DUF6197 family protein, partial [Solirubrobacteraceae bacterium]